MADKLYVASVQFDGSGKFYDYKVPPRLSNTNLKQKCGYVNVRGQLKSVLISDTKYTEPKAGIVYKYLIGISDEYPE